MGFISQISRMNCYCEIKYHANILAVHCNNVTNVKSAKLNSNEITFMRISVLDLCVWVSAHFISLSYAMHFM